MIKQKGREVKVIYCRSVREAPKKEKEGNGREGR